MISVEAPDGVGEVIEGDDLTGLVAGACALHDGDIVTITSKVVSKAEGRSRLGDREEAIAGETVRVVARRGPTSIVRNHLGLTMAAAGIDASNVTAGHHLLLPEDPDATARTIRAGLRERTGHNVAVVITDTAGRPWRDGQTDIAVGAAGLVVLEDFAGRTDAYGNPLAVTAPAVADELAGVAELAASKLSGRPFTVVRGRDDLVLPADDDGLGAAVLIRPDGSDMFGYGSREAVLRALTRTGGQTFGSPASSGDLHRALVELVGPAEGRVAVTAPDTIEISLPARQRSLLGDVETLAFAFGWARSRESDHQSVDSAVVLLKITVREA
ncbi:MAG: coenzyme F420-0:L-glutamate ligase [Nocardioides sp.]|nr:coenzyme F420-0:L-glutamate ligase [Nocardioides sp.]